MKCASCGADIEQTQRFCAYCGTPNDAYKEPAPPPHEPPFQQTVYQQNVYNQHVYQEEPKRVVHTVVHEYHQVRRTSDKSRIALLLLDLFLGEFGVHKFYQGKKGMGVLYLLTFGVFGIGCVVDFFVILLGTPKDGDGLPIEWKK